MKDAVLEIRNGDYSLTLHPSPEAAVAYATQLAKETDFFTEDEIATYLKHGQITEGDWELRLIRAEFPIGVKKEDLYFVCEKKPEHLVWGIYTRDKGKPVTKPFLLHVMAFDYEHTIETACRLSADFPKLDIQIQGAPNTRSIPDKFQP